MIISYKPTTLQSPSTASVISKMEANVLETLTYKTSPKEAVNGSP